MAGRQTEKFLSPAHFQVIPNKPKTKPLNISEGQKLLPPNVYVKAKSPRIIAEGESKLSESKDLKADKTEIDRLRGEVQDLKEHLDKSKAQNREFSEEKKQRCIRNRKHNENDGNWQKLDEVEAENELLLSENRKQQAIISKLRNDIKQIKMDYMSETAKLDDEIATYTATIRQLKQDLKEKDAKFDSDLENTKDMLKKETLGAKELKAELHKAHEQIKAERSNFEDVISEHATQKYQDVKSLQEKLKGFKTKYLTDISGLETCIKEKGNMIDILQNEMNVKELEIKKLKEENEKKEREFECKMNQCRDEIESSQEKFESTCNELKVALQKAMESHDTVIAEFKGKSKKHVNKLYIVHVILERSWQYPVRPDMILKDHGKIMIKISARP